MKLTDFVGKEVTLAEHPHGYHSRHYPVQVGRKYRVMYVDGSALCIEIPNYGHGFIYYGSFAEFRNPATK